MIRSSMALSALIAFLIASAAMSQVANTRNTVRLAEGSKSPAVTIGQFSWLTGYWVGDGFGGVGEEMWSQPLANTMVGTFRLINCLLYTSDAADE